MLHGGQGGYEAPGPPDAGVSAWRSLFVCNELSERLTKTRTISFVTWLAMVAVLEGFGEKDAARWYPRSSGDKNMLSAQFNPFLQFGLGAIYWVLIMVVQQIVQRVASIRFGSSLNDFMDVCSIANISVLFLDEPFHGFYIHGKAPSSRGDWGHTDLARVLSEEGKRIGFTRGLTQDGCQTFEMFLPPDLAVQVAGGQTTHFRQQLTKIFGDVIATQSTIKSRLPDKATLEDIAQLSHCRCSVQALLDGMLHAVMQRTNDVVRDLKSESWFWGRTPEGGVGALQHPIFYKDQDNTSFPSGLAWTSCLACGPEFRIMGLGWPTGFEWHLNLLEFIIFSLVWRFQGSVYLGSALAFAFNQLILRLYEHIGRSRLAHTSIINPMFLL